MKCECLAAGWCERHRVRKAIRMVELCQQGGEYWTAWENNRGPGQVSGKHLEPQLGCEYNHWAPLHYYAVKHQANWDRVKAYVWYWNEWVPNIPKSCGCKEKWIELDLEPDFASPEAFFEWAYHAHERVNAELGKAYRPTLAECYAIWWSEKYQS